MAEWKTDTEEVKQIVKKCRDFKGSLQEEKCTQFIKNLDSYARGILLECRKIELQLQDAIEELRKAKRNEEDARLVLRGLQAASLLSCIWPPTRIAATAAIAAAEMFLKYMKEDTEKCKRNVKLLERALEVYSTQARASRELVEGAWESVKKVLGFYANKHQEFIKRLNYVREAIDNQYNIAPPEILDEGDFESPTIVYHRINKPQESFNIILAFDNDIKGKEYREKCEGILYALTQQFPTIYKPFSKDCNDDLKLAHIIESKTTNIHIMEEFLESSLEKLNSNDTPIQEKENIMDKLEQIDSIKPFNERLKGILENAKENLQAQSYTKGRGR
ncbi:hypothetical protein HpHA283_01770 [Helicobacter pylori]